MIKHPISFNELRRELRQFSKRKGEHELIVSADGSVTLMKMEYAPDGKTLSGSVSAAYFTQVTRALRYLRTGVA